jgi:hypothetical protein
MSRQDGSLESAVAAAARHLGWTDEQARAELQRVTDASERADLFESLGADPEIAARFVQADIDSAA